MSTFGGRFKEPILDCIAVDNFTNINRSCSAFFLSHLHSDHMRGLDLTFFESLIETKKFLYCSKITERFLRKKRKDCASNKNIIAIEVNQCTLITIPDEKFVGVTLISAGHCPGSVMFLFEIEDTKILYTGDFRLPPGDLPKFKALHDSNNKVIKINSIYLDTTFAFPEYETFPSRDESCGELINIVKKWICKGVNYKIGIVPSANYGLEFLVIELAKAVKQKIYIKSDILFENYKCIFELSDFITNDSNSTQIHLCEQSSYPLDCNECKKEEFIKRIKPSAMKFTQKHLQYLNSEYNNGIVDDSNNIISIAYSTHCSLQELKGFLRYVSHSGCKIHACVIKKGFTEQQVLENLNLQETNNEILETAVPNTLQRNLQECEGETSKNSIENEDLCLTRNQTTCSLKLTKQNNDEDPVAIAKDIYGLHSPPRPRKRSKFN